MNGPGPRYRSRVGVIDPGARSGAAEGAFVVVRSGTPGRGPAAASGADDSCPDCGSRLRTHSRWRGLDYGLRPGREVVEQTCVHCGLLRVRVLPAVRAASPSDG